MRAELIPNKDFFDTYKEAILVLSDKNDLIFFNPAFKALTCADISATDVLFFQPFINLNAGEQYHTLQLKIKDSQNINVRVSESVITLTNGKPGRFFTLVTLPEAAGEKRFYELADASPAMIFMQDKNGNAYFFNKAWLSFTGKAVTEQLNAGWMTAIHPEDLRFWDETKTERITERSYASEYRMHKFDGTYRNIYIIGTPIRATDGNVAGYMNSCLDITEVKDAQNRIEQLTRELKHSNDELEQFTYVTSHDMQEPLRMITGYIQLIQKNIEKGNLGVINEFMDFVLSGTARMQLLISDILQLSRVNRKGMPFTAVDMKEVISVAMAHLSAKIKATNANISIGPMPIITGDTFQLVSLFENILDNALKFTTPNIPVQISISADEKDGKYIFEVKDNGIGIDFKFHKRIFAIFQRLHTRGEYEGTGIGLAVCKKIVERHAGEIWVKSEPDMGSTFYFSIKKQ